MSESVMDVVGASPNFNLPGVCEMCDGDGKLDHATPAGDVVVIKCPDCKGTGGSNPENVAKSRAAWKKYRIGLCGE